MEIKQFRIISRWNKSRYFIPFDAHCTENRRQFVEPYSGRIYTAFVDTQSLPIYHRPFIED